MGGGEGERRRKGGGAGERKERMLILRSGLDGGPVLFLRS